MNAERKMAMSDPLCQALPAPGHLPTKQCRTMAGTHAADDYSGLEPLWIYCRPGCPVPRFLRNGRDTCGAPVYIIPENALPALRLTCAIIGTGGTGIVHRSLLAPAILLMTLLLAAACPGQAIPATVGQTLTGKPIVLPEAIHGHAAVFVASFSKEAGPAADAWAKAVRADPALAGVAVFEAAMLERAPGLIRKMVVSSIRKQTPAALQNSFIVFSDDEAKWRSYLGVTADKDPWVLLFDAAGKVVWHGHGASADLEPLLKAALH